jgi:putative endonuclease
MAGESRKARLRALARGRRGEALCVLWLRLKGYRILARNLRTPQGEIDIVARRGDLLAIIEVKRRGDLLSAGEAVTARQRRRLSMAARAVLARMPDADNLSVRFDAMLIGGGRLAHIRDAWRDDGP